MNSLLCVFGLESIFFNDIHFNYNDEKFYDLEGNLLDDNLVLNYELIDALVQYKLNNNIYYVIISSIDASIIKDIILSYFGTNIFDIIMDINMCAEHVHSKQYSILNDEYNNRIIYERNKGEYNATDNPCLYMLSTFLKIDYHFMIYFNNNEEKIKSAKKVIFWSIMCDSLLTTKKFYSVLNDFKTNIYRIDELINVPDDRYLTYTEGQKFIKFLRQLEYKTVNVCCNQEYIKYCVEMINLLYKQSDIYIPYNKILNTHTKELIEYYFDTIRNFMEDGIVYSLGDSLDKLNYIWNIYQIDPTKYIVSIPFSGSMYDDTQDNEIELNKIKEANMYDKLDSLFDNNPYFSQLCDDIMQGHKILITDYGHSGKALITITKLINRRIKTNWSNVWYLQITASPDKISDNIRIHLQNEPYPHIIYKEDMPDSYFTNSDRWLGGYYSRCIPRYEVSNWTSPPSDVWYRGLVPNYTLCNIHRRLLLFQLCCYFNTITF